MNRSEPMKAYIELLGSVIFCILYFVFCISNFLHNFLYVLFYLKFFYTQFCLLWTFFTRFFIQFFLYRHFFIQNSFYTLRYLKKSYLGLCNVHATSLLFKTSIKKLQSKKVQYRKCKLKILIKSLV